MKSKTKKRVLFGISPLLLIAAMVCDWQRNAIKIQSDLVESKGFDTYIDGPQVKEQFYNRMSDIHNWYVAFTTAETLLFVAVAICLSVAVWLHFRNGGHKAWVTEAFLVAGILLGLLGLYNQLNPAQFNSSDYTDSSQQEACIKAYYKTHPEANQPHQPGAMSFVLPCPGIPQ